MGFGNQIVSVAVIESPDELISLDAMKEFMSMQFSENDSIIKYIITSARQYVEGKCNISIGEQKRRVSITHSGDKAMFLPYQPMIDLTSVKYTNCDCMDYTNITDLDQYSLIGTEFVRFKGLGGFYELEYVCGYTEDTIPSELKNIVMQVALSMYENRGDSNWDIPIWVKDQMNVYKMKSWV